MKSHIEKKLSEYFNSAGQQAQFSLPSDMLKTAGVLVGAGLVPCLSAGTSSAAIITGTNFSTLSGAALTTVNATMMVPVDMFFNGFFLGRFGGGGTGYYAGKTYVYPAALLDAHVIGATSTIYSRPYAKVLQPGESISVGAPFGSGSLPASAPFNSVAALRTGEQLLGFKFSIASEGEPDLRLGYIEVDLIDPENLRLISWGYNDVFESFTIPEPQGGEEGGAVPEPGALALLAFGAGGLMAMRKRKFT